MLGASRQLAVDGCSYLVVSYWYPVSVTANYRLPTTECQLPTIILTLLYDNDCIITIENSKERKIQCNLTPYEPNYAIFLSESENSLDKHTIMK